MIVEFHVPSDDPERTTIEYDDEFLSLGLNGTHPAVLDAIRIMSRPRVRIPPDGVSKQTIEWFTLSGFVLALILADNRFAEGREWHPYLPKALQDAPPIEITPANSVPERIY